jgi:hypothetical protein
LNKSSIQFSIKITSKNSKSWAVIKEVVFKDLKKKSNDICRLCGIECLKELKGSAGIINAYKTLKEQSFLVCIESSISLG